MKIKFVKKGEEKETQEYLERHEEELSLRRKAAYDRIVKSKENKEETPQEKVKKMRKKDKVNPDVETEELNRTFKTLSR